MGFALSNGEGWHMGYRYISILQFVLTAILLFSLPLWTKKQENRSLTPDSASSKPLSLIQVLRIPGAREIMVTFFCYCALRSQ